MSSKAIATVVRMMESVPEDTQQQIVDHLREYIEDLRDEIRWDEAFEKTQAQLAPRPAARRKKSQQGKPHRWIWTSYEVQHLALLLGLLSGIGQNCAGPHQKSLSTLGGQPLPSIFTLQMHQ